MQNSLVLVAIIAFIAWYYFAKYQESEKEYNRLQKMYVDICNENARSKSRVEDLQSYKNDVSKTFQILDNELLVINDHIKNQNTQQSSIYSRLQPQQNRESSERISILTPDLLQTLFNGMNQESQMSVETDGEIREQVTENPGVESPVEPVENGQLATEKSEQPTLGTIDSVYSKYLINEEN